jgi:hypothetical protein
MKTTKKSVVSIVDAARCELKKKLNQCTPKQIEIFNRLYGSIDVISFDDMLRAEQQILRTIEKNEGLIRQD